MILILLLIECLFCATKTFFFSGFEPELNEKFVGGIELANIPEQVCWEEIHKHWKSFDLPDSEPAEPSWVNRKEIEKFYEET